MYHVSAQGIDEGMINVHYYYYQFEPVRQDFERVPEHCVSFDMRYSMGFAKSHSLKCSLHKWE